MAGNSYEEGNDHMYAIVDSGASKHILSTDAFFVQSEEASLEISGLGGHIEKAKSCGLWVGTLMDIQGHIFNFDAFGTYIPASKVTL